MFGIETRYLSFFFGLVSILSFFNVIYSYYLNLYLNLDTYYLSFFCSLVISILFYNLKFEQKRLTIFNKILTVFIGYIFIPLVLSIPFYFSIYNLTFLNSYFESISGFTSTGFTVFENIKLIFWVHLRFYLYRIYNFRKYKKYWSKLNSLEIINTMDRWSLFSFFNNIFNRYIW